MTTLRLEESGFEQRPGGRCAQLTQPLSRRHGGVAMRVLTLMDGSLPPARRSMSVDLKSLATGNYRLVLETRTMLKSAAVEVRR